MQGPKVADLRGLEAEGVDRKAVARLFVDAYCQQIFIDGFYHADPHPGNLLAQRRPDGSAAIVFLDFGATAHVSEAMRKGMMNFLAGAMTRDTAKLVAAMKDMGFISRKADPEVFDRVVEYFHDKLRAEVMVEGFSLKDIRFDAEQKIESLLDLRDMNVSLADLRDAFHVPKDWVLLERALLLLLGVCTTLDPEMNPAQTIKPYLERFFVGKGQDLGDAAMEATREAALSALALPGELRRFLSQANRGDVTVSVANLQDGARLVYAVGQQLLWGFLAATAAVLSVVFDGRGQAGARRWATWACVMFAIFLASSLWGGRRAKLRR
jgi:predicted unusual protein kinase regulating ubiquinone biosynthesis (AarF/ABC1/UbiB family)